MMAEDGFDYAAIQPTARDAKELQWGNLFMLDVTAKVGGPNHPVTCQLLPHQVHSNLLEKHLLDHCPVKEVQHLHGHVWIL